MRTALKILVGQFFALVFCVVGLVAAIFLIDWNAFRDEIASAASGYLEREVSIDRLDVSPGWTTWVSVGGLKIANPDWAEAEQFYQADRTGISIQVWPSLLGDLTFSEISMNAPHVNLSRGDDGQATWTFPALSGVSADGPESDARNQFPSVGNLAIRDGRISFADSIAEYRTQIVISRADGRAWGHEDVMMTVDGRIEDRALKVRFTGGSASRLQDTSKPYPISLQIEAEDSALDVSGELIAPLALARGTVELSIKGPTIDALYPILPFPLPETPPYDLTGTLKRQGDVWSFNNFAGRLGDSDLSGSISADTSGERPLVSADLVSRRLILDDLGGLIGAQPNPDETANPEQKRAAEAQDASGKLLPDEPFDTSQLRRADMRIRLKATRVEDEFLPVDDLNAEIDLSNGRLQIRPFALGVAGGNIRGEVVLNAREEIPSADADLQFDGLNLQPFFRGTDYADAMAGRFSGKVYLLGTGNSLRELFSTAEGSGWLGVRDGKLSALIVEGIGLDVIEALAVLIGGDEGVPIRCGMVDFEGDKGTLRLDRAMIDTTDSLVLARGVLDLGRETLDMQLEARAKDFSLIDLSRPVTVSGSFADPDISIGGIDPLPFFEMGDQKDVDCNALLHTRSDPTPRQSPEQ